jgi:hypothetical protein
MRPVGFILITPDEDGEKNIKWSSKKQRVLVFTGFNCLRIGICEHDNEPSGSINGEEFPE